MSNLQTLSTEYHEAEAEAKRLALRYCDISALNLDGGYPIPRPLKPVWLEKIARENLPAAPRQADLDEAQRVRMEASHKARELGQRLYKALLEAGEAYEVLDHSDRLKTKPFEIAAAERDGYVPRSFISAHGSHLRLARYKTREAAEKALLKLTAAELERLS